ncbi:MAG TPA: D-sedoheptulose 7-phosphate isomerase [bacterium]|nr:D-sedoheptulose 7-phosphate isomerase [bacterium]
MILTEKEIYENIKSQLQSSAEIKRKIKEKCSESIFMAARKMTESLQKGGKIFLCGNGGSAADSQHIAAELLVRLNFERDALAAIALTTDTSILTASANDYDFGKIFVRQLQGLAKPGDLLIAISTSGNSGNVIQAVEHCQQNNIQTVGLTGKDGGKLAGLADLVITVPSQNVQRIQEGHITIGHILCDIVEKNLFA